MPRRPWTIDLAEGAERDIEGLLLWTAEAFGPHQADAYARRIDAAFAKLARNPLVAPSRAREDIGPGLRVLHLARRSRHFIIYRIEDHRVRVVRILHDSMDLARHLPNED